MGSLHGPHAIDLAQLCTPADFLAIDEEWAEVPGDLLEKTPASAHERCLRKHARLNGHIPDYNFYAVPEHDMLPGSSAVPGHQDSQGSGSIPDLNGH